jgi:hypothetical protein
LTRLALFALACAGGCTTGETGSIDLAISSASPRPMGAAKPPKMMPPPPPATTCTSDMDCEMPKPHCNATAATCAECVTDVDCPDPKRPLCVRDAGRCGECTTDAECAATQTCAPDFTCHPR